MLFGTESRTENRTKIKICGLRQPEHARAAADCGADAIGLMFYEPSPRNLTVDQAAPLAQSVAGLVSRVGVFVNPEPEVLQHILDTVELDVLQFHGDEDNAFCARWGLPWIKAVRVKDDMDIVDQLKQWPGASAFLLDAYDPAAYGGTGKAFDWSRFPQHLEQPLILAGGLAPANVADAVATVRPWAVDVSSGVEKARGEKDETLIKGFIQEVNNVRR